jgi:cyclin H
MILTEDDLYRTSTQYRLWSFTPEALVTLRTQTNLIATDRVKKAITRSRERRAAQRNDGADDEHNDASDSAEVMEDDIECLTMLEEQKLVEYYCSQCLELGKFFEFPINVIVSSLNPQS